MRIDSDNIKNSSVLGISHPMDCKNILYIGSQNKQMYRCRQLFGAAKESYDTYKKSNKVENDKWHKHKIGACFTRSLYEANFSINDCLLDIVEVDKYDELEFIIGYQEIFHMLPPWNSVRGGGSAYPENNNR